MNLATVLGEMILLVIEQSTDIGSAAILKGQKVLTEQHWADTRVRNRLFDVVRGMLQETGLDLDDVGAYVVGLGPGSYTGLRTSLAAAMAFALPDRRLVYGLNSAEPLARSIMEEYSCASVIVIGDARRGHLWMRRFQNEASQCCRTVNPDPASGWRNSAEAGTPASLKLRRGRLAIPARHGRQGRGFLTKASADGQRASDAGLGDWRLVKLDELQACCEPSSVCVTSDWDRIGARLEPAVPESVALVKERRVPTAASLGRLAAVRMDEDIPSEPLCPIYLHPAVSGK